MKAKDGEGKLTYSEAGVNILEEGDAIRALISRLRFKREGLGRPMDIGGHYTGIVEFGEWYLSLCTDGVGSKMKIAEAMGKWDTVGIDCMAMNVNDMICIGAEPLAFVDYIASDHPDTYVLGEIGKGLNAGCEMSNVSIIGGETASLPDMVDGLDLAGTCMGVVKKDRTITGSSIGIGDLIIGIPSTGIHSNGYTLVRRVLKRARVSYQDTLWDIIGRRAWKARKAPPELKGAVESWARSVPDLKVGEALLTPTKIYVRDIMKLLKGMPEGSVHGLAHITGGGMRNLSRLKKELGFVIDRPLDVPPIFHMVQVLGGVDSIEMYQTFNMGMGFSVIVSRDASEMALSFLQGSGARIVGRMTGERGVHLVREGISYPGYV